MSHIDVARQAELGRGDVAQGDESKHLHACESCRAAIAAEAQLHAWLGPSLPAMPHGFEARLLKRWQQERRGRHLPLTLWLMVGAALMLDGVALLTVMAVPQPVVLATVSALKAMVVGVEIAAWVMLHLPWLSVMTVATAAMVAAMAAYVIARLARQVPPEIEAGLGA